MARAVLAVSVLTAVIACSDDDADTGTPTDPPDTGAADSGVEDTGIEMDAGPEDAGMMDAGMMDAGEGMNALGETCRMGGSDCPADHTCTIFPLVGGSAERGYCSPMCQTTEDCTTGFAGPGTALCFQPPQCSISCSTPMGENECPMDLTCLPTGGPTNACGVAANVLGQLCGEGEPDCPANHTCAIFPLVGGSTTKGYCTPVCQTTDDCTADYMGPGSPSCFRAPECSISCTTPMASGECPPGLTCLPTGGPTSACGVAQ
ncbi:MAG: hypothetical protein AAFZ18_37795 [Myxococcota bacterium]